jgi:hypothetical protein
MTTSLCAAENHPTDATMIGKAAEALQSALSKASIYHFGEAPEMQVDFHIPCTDDEHALMADTLVALAPCLQGEHVASAFRAGDFIQVSLHKEPSPDHASAVLQDSLARISSDSAFAARLAQQINSNRQDERERAKARMQRLAALKKNAISQLH